MPIFKKKNEHFFKKWTPEMAYALGFFAADGNLTAGPRGNHYVEFTSTDQELIEHIRSFLIADHKISVRRKRAPWKTAYRLQIGSKIMFQDLVAIGFQQRKSMELRYPLIPKPFFSHFVRGYLDGDGHVTTGIFRGYGGKGRKRVLISGFTCGTRSFLENLWHELKRQDVVRGGTLYNQKNYYRLTFSAGDSLSLYDFLYRGVPSHLYLARKREVFERYRKGW